MRASVVHKDALQPEASAAFIAQIGLLASMDVVRQSVALKNLFPLKALFAEVANKVCGVTMNLLVAV